MSALTASPDQTQAILGQVAQELGVSESEAMAEGLRTLLEKNLHVVQARIFEIRGRYGVASVEDLEDRYRQGTLDEASSWRDLQALDHLEYRTERLQQLISALP